MFHVRVPPQLDGHVRQAFIGNEPQVFNVFEARCARVARYRKAHPKAAETLCRDWERMATFYRFPKAHWVHLRTPNVVESPFSAVRLRTDAAKRYKKVASAEALIWKILLNAEKKFRRLNAAKVLEDVFAGRSFVDGVAVRVSQRRLAA